MSKATSHYDNMEDIRDRLENTVTQSSVSTIYDGEDCFITVAQKNYETGNNSEWSFCVDFGTNKVQMLEPVEDEEGFTSDNEVYRIIKNFLNGGMSREKRMNRPDYDSGEPIKSGLDITMYALFTDGGNAYSSSDNGNWYWTTSDNDYYEDEKDFKSSVRRMAKRKAERNYGEYDPSTLKCKFFSDKDKFLKACENVGITPSINSSRKPIKSSLSDILQDKEALQYFTVEELQKMNYNEWLLRKITADEHTENDNLIAKLYKEHILKSSRKPIKSGMYDTLIGKSDNGEYSLYLSDCKYANHGKDPHQEYMLAHNGQVTDTVRTDDPYATSVKEHWQDVFHIKGVKSSRKSIKSSLEDRLIPYLEEFEEGYSNAMVDDPMDHYAGVDTTQVRLETFFEIFKNDYNLSDDDINKLENAVLDIWNETNNEINQNEWNER